MLNIGSGKDLVVASRWLPIDQRSLTPRDDEAAINFKILIHLHDVPGAAAWHQRETS